MQAFSQPVVPQGLRKLREHGRGEKLRGFLRAVRIEIRRVGRRCSPAERAGAAGKGIGFTRRPNWRDY